MHVEGNRRVKFEGNPGDPFRTRGHRDLHAKRLLYSDTYKGCHKRFTCIFTRYDHPKSVPKGNRRVKFGGNPGEPFGTRGHEDLHVKRLMHSDTYKRRHKRSTCIFTRYGHPKCVPSVQNTIFELCVWHLFRRKLKGNYVGWHRVAPNCCHPESNRKKPGFEYKSGAGTE